MSRICHVRYDAPSAMALYIGELEWLLTRRCLMNLPESLIEAQIKGLDGHDKFYQGEYLDFRG